jgi:hypothetical protein
MKIRVIGHGGEGRFPFGNSGPWKEFEKVLEARGHSICSADMTEKADAVITNAYNSRIARYLEKSEIPVSRRILVLWEPYIVETIRYRIATLSAFGAHFAPSIQWAERVDAHPFKWPQDAIPRDQIFDHWRFRKKQGVMVQGNKFSARKGELYSLRRKVIINLDSDDLDLYGTNWNDGFRFDWLHWSMSLVNSNYHEISLKSLFGIGKKYRNYKGVTSDKNKTLSEYKISIVIENSADFVSEKLFDSARAGCVSVYVGPSLEQYGIPAESAIQVQPNFKIIVETVRNLMKESDKQLEEIARTQRNCLMKVSPDWDNSLVLSKLASDMADILEAK